LKDSGDYNDQEIMNKCIYSHLKCICCYKAKVFIKKSYYLHQENNTLVAFIYTLKCAEK